MELKKCLCGKPIIYPNSFMEAYTEALIKKLGYYTEVVSPTTGKIYKVPRDHIAVHILDMQELTKFPEKKEDEV